jgi:drug/metabolite transporter (DMT)-like permease
LGVLLALLGATAFSVMNVSVRNGVRPGDRDNGVLTTVVINVALFSALILGIAVFSGVPALNPTGVVAFIAAGLASTFFGRLTLFAAIRRAGAVRAAAVKNATPLVALFIALTLLGERLTVPAALGILLVLLGVGLVVRESLARASTHDLRADRHIPVREGLESEALADGGSAEEPYDPAAALDRPPAGARRTALIGLGLAGLAALTFGTGHVLRKVGMDALPDAAVGAAIGSWAALTGYVVSAGLRGRLSTLRTSISGRKPWFWMAGLGGGLGQIAFFAALSYAPVAHVSVVAASETILTVAIAGLVAHRTEHISRHLVLPATLVCAGVAAIALSR